MITLMLEQSIENHKPITTPRKRRIVYEECSREESKHSFFGASKGSPAAVYVFTGSHITEWLEQHCQEEDFSKNGYFFVRRVEA